MRMYVLAIKSLACVVLGLCTTFTWCIHKYLLLKISFLFPQTFFLFFSISLIFHLVSEFLAVSYYFSDAENAGYRE